MDGETLAQACSRKPEGRGQGRSRLMRSRMRRQRGCSLMTKLYVFHCVRLPKLSILFVASLLMGSEFQIFLSSVLLIGRVNFVYRVLLSSLSWRKIVDTTNDPWHRRIPQSRDGMGWDGVQSRAGNAVVTASTLLIMTSRRVC